MNKPSWEELREDCKNCNRCGLRKDCTQVVLGHGPKNAKVMFVGEAPGKDEDKEGKPFVGDSGKLLDKLLADANVGLSREDIYITNVVKCRPPKNRKPKIKEEVNFCKLFLDKEIKLLRPKIIVCIGNVAACQLIDEKFKVTARKQKFKEDGDIIMMGTYHPGWILLDKKSRMPLAIEDFELLGEKIKEVCK